MASATGPSIVSRRREQKSASAASTAMRSAARLGSAAAVAEVVELEGAIGLLPQLHHLRFGRRELSRRRAQPLDPLLEQAQRAIEGEVLALQLGDDLLEAPDVRLERHR